MQNDMLSLIAFQIMTYHYAGIYILNRQALYVLSRKPYIIPAIYMQSIGRKSPMHILWIHPPSICE